MQPVVTPVFGYLCYTAYTRAQHGRLPEGEPSVIAGFATVLPDLIDQPLWLLGITAVGRTFAHSLFGGIFIIGLIGFFSRRHSRRILGVAFAIGYCAHIVADVPWHVLAGDYQELGFLLWPVTDMPAYSGVKVVGTVGSIHVTTLWFEGVIFVVGVLIWWYDGSPGCDVVDRYVRNK